MTKKFYNTELEATGASSGSEPVSIAEMMAKEGKMSGNDGPAIPVVSRSDFQEPAQPSSSPVETTNEQPASTGYESSSDDNTNALGGETPWSEVLRQQRLEDVLTELGYDEDSVHFMKELKDVDPKMVEILSRWKDDGDSVIDYLKELSVDYGDMPSEEVMRHQLREEYPKATERQLEVLYRKEIVERYNLDSMDDDLVEEGRALLDAKAEAFRDKLISRQQDFLLPKYDKKVDDTEVRAQKEFDNYKSNLLQDQLTRQLLETKRLTIGEGEDKFNYAISDPQSVINNLFDSNEWASKLFEIKVDSEGNEQYVPNIEKQLLVSAILNDHKGFLREMGKYYKSMGGKATIDSLDNPKPFDSAGAPGYSTEPRTPAEYMARYGRLG